MAKNNNTVKYVALGAGALILFPAVREIMEQLGFWQSKESKDFDNNQNNPYSYWNPLFWTQGPENTLLITEAGCQWLYNEIYNSFGVFDDDEGRIYAAFKSLKTQSQLSYFSYWCREKKGVDLLDWLKGGNYGPVGDHLSTSEIAYITEYFKKLPKYRP